MIDKLQAVALLVGLMVGRAVLLKLVRDRVIELLRAIAEINNMVAIARKK